MDRKRTFIIWAIRRNGNQMELTKAQEYHFLISLQIAENGYIGRQIYALIVET